MQETRVLLRVPRLALRRPLGRRTAGQAGARAALHASCAAPGYDADVLDLEAELGNPADDAARESFLPDRRRPARRARGRTWSSSRAGPPCSTRPPSPSPKRVRRQLPDAVIAACGLPRLGAPGRLQRSGRALRLARRRRGRDGGRDARRAGRRGRARDGGVPLAGGHAAAAGRRAPARLRRLPVHGRGAAGARPLPQPRLPVQRAGLPAPPRRRPAGTPTRRDVAVAPLDAASQRCSPGRVLVLDPAFGYEAGWRRAVLDLLAAGDRRDLAVSVTGRPETLKRLDADKLYRGARGPGPRGGHALAGPARPDGPGAAARRRRSRTPWSCSST